MQSKFKFWYWKEVLPQKLFFFKRKIVKLATAFKYSNQSYNFWKLKWKVVQSKWTCLGVKIKVLSNEMKLSKEVHHLQRQEAYFSTYHKDFFLPWKEPITEVPCKHLSEYPLPLIALTTNQFLPKTSKVLTTPPIRGVFSTWSNI